MPGKEETLGKRVTIVKGGLGPDQFVGKNAPLLKQGNAVGIGRMTARKGEANPSLRDGVHEEKRGNIHEKERGDAVSENEGKVHCVSLLGPPR